MSTDVDQALADGRVKEPLSREFLLESKDASALLGISLVITLTTAIVLGRVLSRLFIVKRFGYDDVLAVLSWACLIGFVCLCIRLIELGSGRHFAYIKYVLPVDVVIETQVLDFAAHIVYTTALLFCRMSGLSFYHRVCGLHQGFHIALYAVGGIILAGYLPQILLIVFHCHPVTGLWPYGWEPGADQYTCLEWSLVYSVNSVVSLVCDLLLFGIPIAMLKLLEMPRRRKVQLGLILLPGMSVIGISIARLILVLEQHWQTDMSWAYDPMLAVEVSEIGTTLISLSFPGFKPLFDMIIRKKNPNTGLNGFQITSQRSKGTELSTLRLRSEDNMLPRPDKTTTYEHEVIGFSGWESGSQDGEDGIFVRVDFDLKEEAQVGIARAT